MNVFIFDIETIPDVVGARRLWGLNDLPDRAVADVMYNKPSQQTGGTSDFPCHHLHRIDDEINHFKEFSEAWASVSLTNQ